MGAGDKASSAACTVVGGRSNPVGRSLVRMLLESRRWGTVRIADLAPSFQSNHSQEAKRESFLLDSLQDGRASYTHVDVRDKSQVVRAIRGSCAVFLMDLAELSSGSFVDQYSLVVGGTKNVISACRDCKVQRLVYNSSADVVFDGRHDILNGNESLPYPHKFADMLSDLKAQAESMVLFANEKDGLLTCALRPSLPFGAFGSEDKHLLDFLIGCKVSGPKFLVGSGRTTCDLTYVENVAHAHKLTEEALFSGATSVAGEPFFITNCEPMNHLALTFFILEDLGYQRPKVILPLKFILFIMMSIEWASWKFGFCRSVDFSSSLTTLKFFSHTRCFDCSRAQSRINYLPLVSLQEGVMQTIKSLPYLDEPPPFAVCREFSSTSKAEKLLGSKADLLLWRNDRKTFLSLLLLFFLLYWFLMSGRTFITSIARLFQLVTCILFVHGRLPSSICGFNVPKISSSYFEVSEISIKIALKSLASIWNRSICIISSISRADNGSLVLKTAMIVYAFKLLLRFSISSLIAVGLIILFSAFIIYEHYESQIDRFISSIAVHSKYMSNQLRKKLHPRLTVLLQKIQYLS